MKKLILILCLLVAPIIFCSCAMPFFALSGMQQAIEQSRSHSNYYDSSYDSYDDPYYDSDYSYDDYDSGYDDGYSDGYDYGYSDGYDDALSEVDGGYAYRASESATEYTINTVPATFALPDSFSVSPVKGDTAHGWEDEAYEAFDSESGALFIFASQKNADTQAIQDFTTAGDQALWDFLQKDMENMMATPGEDLVMSDYGIARLGYINYVHMRFTRDDLHIDQYYTVKNGVMMLFETQSYDKEPEPATQQILRDIVESATYN
ncbi:MAG: hypothetical protein VB081_04860 [Christensenella sp.]|uniref:hypothetical protein n=1 Tax=Christensenella sp. TaxID=1935934 RepID=UPI002B1EE419|nr:hypothetical protein [Christensenella sp.]MEA5002810.1 hypothetical protein [Christensenella sp.]